MLDAVTSPQALRSVLQDPRALFIPHLPLARLPFHGGHHAAGLTAAPNSPNRRQVDEGGWPPPNNLLNQSPKKVTAETDFNKSLDFEMPPPSPPLNLHELSGPAEGAPVTPKGGNPTKGLETPGSKRSVDKAVSVEVLGLGLKGTSEAQGFFPPS